ncbi:galanin receptor type 1-like [Stylophora pistillata]|uniref:galanin receptor type 1-like n=1 Tax=Stylophora pistillata TaxID=50429 RepID=UPI000C03DDD6|nr:galanin receptor type 1-like [Stylophora pistillata]XP_022787796.1 galanin receptor type 1-like [Stylophora pistillata]
MANSSEHYNSTGPLSYPLYGTKSDPSEALPVEVVKLTLYASCASFGVIGNILVTVILNRIKVKETRVMDFYMINLAIADLGTLLLALPFAATRERLPNYWPFGEFVCLYFLPVVEIFHGSSVWFITAASIERYQKIGKPSKVNFKLRASLKKAKIVAACVWMASFFLFSFPLYFVVRYREISNEGKIWCGAEWPLWGKGFVLPQAYLMLMVLLSYIFPLIVILWTFLAVSRTLNESSRFIKTMKQGEDRATLVMNHCDKGDCTPRRRSLRIAQNKRAKAILTPVVVVFAVFMLPLAMLRLCIVFWPPIVVQTSYENLMFVVSLGVIINSSTNPLIYSVIKKDFRRELKRIFQYSRT